MQILADYWTDNGFAPVADLIMPPLLRTPAVIVLLGATIRRHASATIHIGASTTSASCSFPKVFSGLSSLLRPVGALPKIENWLLRRVSTGSGPVSMDKF